MRQRTWLAAAVVVIVVAVLASLAAPPAPAQSRTFAWKVQSSFPVTDYPHRSLVELAKSIEQMSGGRLKIEPLPVGAVVGFFEVLDAVNRGALDGGLTWPGLWAGKNSAAGLFGSPLGGPFGMGQNEFTAWLFSGGVVSRDDLRLLAYLGETHQEIELLRDKVPALLGDT